MPSPFSPPPNPMLLFCPHSLSKMSLSCLVRMSLVESAVSPFLNARADGCRRLRASAIIDSHFSLVAKFGNNNARGFQLSTWKWKDEIPESPVSPCSKEMASSPLLTASSCCWNNPSLRFEPLSSSYLHPQ